jgi:hypothetical protein
LHCREFLISFPQERRDKQLKPITYLHFRQQGSTFEKQPKGSIELAKRRVRHTFPGRFESVGEND